MPGTLRDAAVLTGDIVRSSRLSPAELDRAMAALARGADRAAAWIAEGDAAGSPDGDFPARFTRFRGDGWQCLAPSPSLTLRTALLLKAHLRREGRAFDTRVSIGIGGAELPASGDLAAASGPAFRVAGHGLDAMRRTARLAIGWEAPPAEAAGIAAILALADAVTRRWTPAQAETLVLALPPQPGTQEAMAAALGVSQQMVAKHLAAAGGWALELACATLEGR